MGRCVLFSEGRQNLVDCHIPDVHQHVCIREAFHSTNLLALCRRGQAIQNFTAVVLLKHLPVRNRGYTIVVELQPSRLAVRFNEGEIVTPVQISGVYEYTMKFVYPRLCLVRSLVQELSKVYFKGKFMSIIDLWKRCD